MTEIELQAELNDLRMSKEAQPLFDAVKRHIADNVDPITEEFFRLGEGRTDRWSWAPGQLELLEGAVERFVFEHPVLANLVNAAELRVLPAAERAAAIQRIAGSLRSIAMTNARYRCSNCGYSTQRFIWHCPSCKLWETVRPIQSVPLENVLARP